MWQDASALAVLLEEACQASTPDCTLVSEGSRRRALQGTAGTGVAVLARPLTSGSLAAEIPQLNSTGVDVTNTSFEGVDVLVSVTKQGGAEEAEALLNGSLAADQAPT